MVLGFRNDSFYSFNRIQFIIFEINFGWFIRLVHINFVSFFFVVLFLHFFKALFFFSYKIKETWNIGLLLVLILIGESFFGYVLIWSQISFWACTVITSLLMVIPFYGLNLVFWVWSNYYVSILTLKLFFLIHFILPFILIVFIFLHLFFLHNYCRTSKIYLHGEYDKVTFFPYFWLKDILNLFVIVVLFRFILFFPFYFNDSEMFLEINHLVSPVHIVP